MRHFLSLKWKALILLSLVLISINASFYFLNSKSLQGQFERERELLHERNTIAVRSLIEQSSQQLLRMSELLPAMYGVRDALVDGDDGALGRVLDQNPSLQLGQGIDTMAFFDTSNRITAQWGDTSQLPAAGSPLFDIIRQVTTTEAPATQLDCAPRCMQYAVVPVLSKSRIAGALLLGTSLSGVIVDFNKIAAGDIGIITPHSAVASDSNGQPRLAPWNADVAALTRSETMLDVLVRAAGQRTLKETLTKGTLVARDDRGYEVRLLPINGLSESSRGYLVTVHDVTSQIDGIQQAKHRTLAIGIAGLLLSESMLLLVVWKPLSRLRRTASALPLLASSAFDTARAAIGRQSAPAKIGDEIDQLDDSAIALSHQLETLENEVLRRTTALSEKMDELTRERDFVRGLLETAQVIVVTLDVQQRILLMNRFGEGLCGRSVDQLQGRFFAELFPPEQEASEQVHLLNAVAQGRRLHWRQESTLDVPGDLHRHIDWIHSHLSGSGSAGPAVLSVGLDITERKRAEQRIAWLADHDPLTGLFNRRRFQEELESIVRASVRYQHPGALMFIDLDHFKYINDTRGHHAGDAVIKAIAKELSQMLRISDRISRLGGDEFAVAMPEIGRDEAVAVARKINDRLGTISIPESSMREKISSSIGVVLFPQHGTAAEELLANADLAMYQAKEFGRSRWHLFSEGEQARERIQTQVLWKQRIEDALAADRFLLHYQPIADVRAGTVAHYEVLLRMRDESGSVIFPSSFIGIAERVGLIRAIDHMVLEKTITKIRELPADRRSLCFSLNLSAHAFADPELLPLLQDLLSSGEVDPHRLIFEITETAALADFEAACSLMETIQSMGCKFAIDDFGVGFSSFYYLKQLPVDYVKIDGSFIRDLAHNRDDQVLVKAMGEIARGFGKKTVAEYVEDATTLGLLRDYNIDFAQGYHVGRPLDKVA
jgi:diguanylate cyclase (GGDEF)-like protein/PAS domain S-box-containing protein